MKGKVPLKHRLFAHKAMDGQFYCYGAGIAYQFSNAFTIVAMK